MRRWILAAGLAMALAGCADSPYQAALDAPPPAPRPTGQATAGDQRAMAPYQPGASRPAVTPAHDNGG